MKTATIEREAQFDAVLAEADAWVEYGEFCAVEESEDLERWYNHITSAEFRAEGIRAGKRDSALCDMLALCDVLEIPVISEE